MSGWLCGRQRICHAKVVTRNKVGAFEGLKKDQLSEQHKMQLDRETGHRCLEHNVIPAGHPTGTLVGTHALRTHHSFIQVRCIPLPCLALNIPCARTLFPGNVLAPSFTQVLHQCQPCSIWSALPHTPSSQLLKPLALVHFLHDTYSYLEVIVYVFWFTCFSASLEYKCQGARGLVCFHSVVFCGVEALTQGLARARQVLYPELCAVFCVQSFAWNVVCEILHCLFNWSTRFFVFFFILTVFVF